MNRQEGVGGQVLEEAKEMARSVIMAPKNAAAEKLADVAGMLRQTAKELHGQKQDIVAAFAERAAAQCEKFSGTLRQADLEELIEEVETYARRSPAVLFAVSALLGFTLTRFIRSSGKRHAASTTVHAEHSEHPEHSEHSEPVIIEEPQSPGGTTLH